MLMSACGGGSSGTGTGPIPGTGSATLSWDAPTTNFDQSCLTNLTGYRIYYGTTSGRYTYKKEITLAQATCANSGAVGSCGPVQACSARISGLDAGTWYFVISATNADGDSGIVSGESSAQVAANP